MAEISIPRGDGGGKMPNPRTVTGLVTIIVILLLVFSSFGTMLYMLNPEEVGVIQRFGKYVRTTYPGLHVKIPFGVETLIKVKKERVETEEFGFKTKKAGVRTIYYTGSESQFRTLGHDSYGSKLGFKKDPFLGESLMLTGDLNCAEVEWAVQYKVKDPVMYCFNVRDVVAAIRDVSEATMRQVVGDASIDEILTTGKLSIQEKAKQLLQEILDEYGTGIEIVDLVLQDVNPPAEVKDSFNEVNEAMQDREKITNQARAKYNQIIPRKEGEAEKMILNAEGYAINRVNNATGDADRFLATWNEYKNAKDITKRRLYLETMLKVMPKIQKKIIIDSETKGILPLLNLNEETKKGGTA
ncbi:FtsH protease activity modulator HflK [Candidatus Omnitrophota bacterium]